MNLFIFILFYISHIQKHNFVFLFFFFRTIVVAVFCRSLLFYSFLLISFFFFSFFGVCLTGQSKLMKWNLHRHIRVKSDEPNFYRHISWFVFAFIFFVYLLFSFWIWFMEIICAIDEFVWMFIFVLLLYVYLLLKTYVRTKRTYMCSSTFVFEREFVNFIQ